MKSYLQALIGTALAVLLAYSFIWVAKENMGLNPESIMLDNYNNYMLEAKSYFVDGSDQFNDLSLGIFNMDGLTLLRGKSGEVNAVTDGQLEAPDAAFAQYGAENPAQLAELSGELMLGSQVAVENSDGDTLLEAYTQVQSVRVTEEAVYFYTHYRPDGLVGFLYLKDADADLGLSLIALTDEWYVFYNMEK